VETHVQTTLERLDALMNRLVEADQTGNQLDPQAIAKELGEIRASLMRGRAVVPRAKGGERHFRCDACGTIVHGSAAPASCPTCRKTVFYEADLETTTVDAGPG
jgi:rubrerythrin